MDIVGLTDDDLPQDKRLWLDRNHFEIVKLSRDDDVVGDGIMVGRDYDEAMDRFLAYGASRSNR